MSAWTDALIVQATSTAFPGSAHGENAHPMSHTTRAKLS